MKIKVFTYLVISAILVVSCAPSNIEDSSVVIVEEESVAEEKIESEEVMAESEDTMEKEEVPASDNNETADVSFITDIWPIIESEALSAHGGSGGVFLESYEDILKYVVPGKPEESQLYQALTGDGHKLMPPSGPLPDAQIQLFYNWILQGANNN